MLYWNWIAEKRTYPIATIYPLLHFTVEIFSRKKVFKLTRLSAVHYILSWVLISFLVDPEMLSPTNVLIYIVILLFILVSIAIPAVNGSFDADSATKLFESTTNPDLSLDNLQGLKMQNSIIYDDHLELCVGKSYHSFTSNSTHYFDLMFSLLMSNRRDVFNLLRL